VQGACDFWLGGHEYIAIICRTTAQEIFVAANTVLGVDIEACVITILRLNLLKKRS
jgi:hypothetical protein